MRNLTNKLQVLYAIHDLEVQSHAPTWGHVIISHLNLPSTKVYPALYRLYWDGLIDRKDVQNRRLVWCTEAGISYLKKEGLL